MVVLEPPYSSACWQRVDGTLCAEHSGYDRFVINSILGSGLHFCHGSTEIHYGNRLRTDPHPLPRMAGDLEQVWAGDAPRTPLPLPAFATCDRRVVPFDDAATRRTTPFFSLPLLVNGCLALRCAAGAARATPSCVRAILLPMVLIRRLLHYDLLRDISRRGAHTRHSRDMGSVVG